MGAARARLDQSKGNLHGVFGTQFPCTFPSACLHSAFARMTSFNCVPGSGRVQRLTYKGIWRFRGRARDYKQFPSPGRPRLITFEVPTQQWMQCR